MLPVNRTEVPKQLRFIQTGTTWSVFLEERCLCSDLYVFNMKYFVLALKPLWHALGFQASFDVLRKGEDPF